MLGTYGGTLVNGARVQMNFALSAIHRQYSEWYVLLSVFQAPICYPPLAERG